jgi:hypothetical protein
VPAINVRARLGERARLNQLMRVINFIGVNDKGVHGASD